MIVSPGTSRKFWRVTPKQLLLFVKQNAYLPRNVLKVQLLSELNQGSLHSASINLIRQPNRLSWSRESLADELDHSGANRPGLDCRPSRYLTDGMVNSTTILQGMVACRTESG